MKRIALIALALCCLLALAGCGCEHEWVEADCVNPKTCSLCEETEGEALGHTWVDADCVNPKTCSVCAETEGEALGHTWVDADCENAKTCSVCAETEGEALGHTWLDATTEAPQTCEVCAATEGDPIDVDDRFTTAACSAVFGKWQSEMTLPAETLDPALVPYMADIPVVYYIEFTNDGNASMSFAAADDSLEKAMLAYTVDAVYAEFEAEGMNKEEADAAMVAAYGLNVEEYAAASMAMVDMNDLFAAMKVNYVYYVEKGQIYLGFSWNAEMSPSTYTLDGDTLTIDMDGEATVFTRVTE